MTYRFKVFVSAFVSGAVFIILFLLLPSNDRNYINVLTILGILLSLLGLVIAYFQLVSVKQIALETKQKVKDSITLNNNILMISDLSRKVAMVSEIQGYLRDGKIELCILRMNDLKIVLISLRNQNQYSTLVSKATFRKVFDSFSIDLYNFQRHSVDNSAIDLTVVMKNLNELSTLFLSVEIKLKTPKL